MNAKDETANSYVLITQLATCLGLQAATVKSKAKALGIEWIKIRNPRANNALSAALPEADAKRIIEAVRSESALLGAARILAPEEISKLMEEA